MRRAAALALAVCAASGVPTAAASSEGDLHRPGTTRRYAFTNEFGTREYLLHVPRGYRGRPVPFLLYLHGCSQSAEIARVQTHLDAFADRNGFIVAFPEQPQDAHANTCWNWYVPDHWSRGAGEPAILEGITRQVMGRYRVDRRRVFASGLSAGGAMSVVMAAAYPDVFAAIAVHAGCEYRGAPCVFTPAALPPERSGEWAFEEMGPRARQVPVFAVVGTLDTIAPKPNSDALVEQWLWTSDWADDGAANGSVSKAPARTVHRTPIGRRPYDVSYYRDARGCPLEEYWVVDGMQHAYSGGDGSQMYSDPEGPDVNPPMWRFLMAHPMAGGARLGRCA